MAKKPSKQGKKLDKRILDLAKRLEQIRKEKGYTSYENFAIEKGLPRMQYWRMEKGVTNFRFESLLKILDAHDLTLEEFFKDFD